MNAFMDCFAFLLAANFSAMATRTGKDWIGTSSYSDLNRLTLS